MKKYLVVLSIDVADEGDVGLIKVITQKELDETKSILTGFGNIDGESYEFDKSDAVEITNEEIKVLEKFGLTDLQFGYCSLSDEEVENEDDDEEYDD
jgi:hypothetical protein